MGEVVGVDRSAYVAGYDRQKQFDHWHIFRLIHILLFFKSYFDTDICIKLAQMVKDFMILCLKHLLYFTVSILYNIHAPTQICIYICVCVRELIYARLCT